MRFEMSSRNTRIGVHLPRILFPAISGLILSFLGLTVAQNAGERRDSFNKSCTGLHAGIRAQIIPPYTETPSVMLSFVLLNDSSASIDVQAGSWKIVVDEHELKESGMLFGNGVMPVGGYTVLKPGESYELGKSLAIVDYFLPNGIHKVSWRGTGFQSPTVDVTITPASH